MPSTIAVALNLWVHDVVGSLEFFCGCEILGLNISGQISCSSSSMTKTVKYFDNEREEVNSRLKLSSDELLNQRRQLPMFQGRREVVNEILNNRVTVIVGETGSGKSTQLPQALLEIDPKQNIVVTQPRRVAAISLAHRVSAEAGCKLGSKVGYNVRFDAKVSKHSKIRYYTDGMLLREFMLDPTLQKYTTVIIDEAHERTVTSDLVLGLLKRLLRNLGPRNFRVVVMSATLDSERFSDFFGSEHCRKLYVPGRAFPVERYYVRSPVANIVDAASQAVLQINHGEPGGGDILVFLPGQDEIESAAEILREAKREKGSPKLVILPLYASLPESDQQLAFLPASSRQRKVILATNIAETSVTIPGVRFVVDSGIRKVRMYRSALGLESLLPAPISQASAAQRMGRAGREGSGKCWRLYTESTYFNDMSAQTEPEILRVSLSFPILLLKTIGVEDILNFPWIDPPSKVAVSNALLQLYSLKAIENSGKISNLGHKMAKLPLEPPLAAVLVNACTDYPVKVREAILDVAACLSVQDLLLTPSPARRQEVNERRQELFPAAFKHGDLALVKLIWDAQAKIDKHDLKEWCFSVGVSPRALKKVAQVRKQLTSYLSDSLKSKIRDPAASKDLEQAENSDEDESSELDTDEDFDSEDFELLIRAFLSGFITNSAIALPDRRFQSTLTQQPVSIHPGSTMFGSRPSAIMYLEYVYTVRGYARLVSPIDLEWLKAAAPHLLARATVTQL